MKDSGLQAGQLLHDYQGHWNCRDIALEHCHFRTPKCGSRQHHQCEHSPFCHKLRTYLFLLQVSFISTYSVMYLLLKRRHLVPWNFVFHRKEGWSIAALEIPRSRPRTSLTVRHKSWGRLGPTMNDGRRVTRSILFSFANSQAAFSARTFARAYHILDNKKQKEYMSIIQN